MAEQHLVRELYRWLFYQSRDGRLLSANKSFDLPSTRGETMMVEVSLNR